MPLIAELELRVMLGVLQRGPEAFATGVHEEIERRTGRRTSLGSMYITLDRLEKKGLLRSKLGEPTAARGGRARRYYSVTATGMRALKAECLGTQRMWAGRGIVPEERGPPRPAGCCGSSPGSCPHRSPRTLSAICTSAGRTIGGDRVCMPCADVSLWPLPSAGTHSWKGRVCHRRHCALPPPSSRSRFALRGDWLSASR